MANFIKKIPFLLELFVNGSFILLYSLRSVGRIPITWPERTVVDLLEYGSYLAPLVLFLGIIINLREVKRVDLFFRKYIFSFIVFIPMLIALGDIEFCFWLSSAHLLSSILSIYDKEQDGGEETPSKPTFDIYKFTPAQIVLFTFASAILISALILMLPVSAAPGKSISFVDALFMTTSATCVTGLSTISLASDLSVFGQMVLLVMIQIGGLGIMTLSSSMAVLLGKSVNMKERVVLQGILDAQSLDDLYNMVIDILRYTFIIETWGGILLTIGFSMEGFEFGQALYFGFFHSVSAFCNAGLALFDNNLESFANKPLIHGTIAALIVLGGLGFVVLKEMKQVINRKKNIKMLSLHSKTVLLVSAMLIVSGAVIIFFSDFTNALDSYNLFEKTQVALFQSITTRTAGFNTIPLGQLNSYTIYVMIIYMFIGASPGSTGGGLKTTTVAILFQSVKATLKGRSQVNLLGWRVPDILVVRSTALALISIILVAIFIFAMLYFEPTQGFLPLCFEVVSAFGTVGLSLGLTPQLTVAGKLVISLLMYIGRVGPLTLVLALGEDSQSSGKVLYPEGRIMIG